MPASPHRSEHNRPALIALVIVAALAFLGLGWWQWERFESASGTGQNLGYALQWPLFAAFAVFAYFRFVRLEREAGAPADTGTDGDRPDTDEHPASAGRPPRAKRSDGPREIPAGILPERPKAARESDPVLDEYNRYLAGLHAGDLDDQVRHAGLDRRDTERSSG